MSNHQTKKKQYLSIYDHERICDQKIFTLLPSNVKNIELDDIFHGNILNNMKDYLKKDIQEALDCYYYEQWTATSLMCFRIIERELKTHINCDLEIDENITSFFRCIEVLNEENYDQDFLDKLDEIRELRNLGMHGEKRFSPDDAKYLVRNAFFIVSWIYNFY